MKASRIVYLSAAMLLLAGCSTEKDSEQDAALLPVVLGSTVADAPLTRAANDLNNTYLTAGQQVTVRISPTGENNYTDYTYTTAAGGVMTPPAENKPYYPMTGNVDIRAYHPASAATGNTVGTFEVAADQTTDANYIASDLLWADTDNSDNALTNLAKTASTRTLKFQHKLSKITVNATPDGVAVTSITGITLNNVKRKVSFDPSTGTTSLTATDNDPTTVTMSNNGAAIIPPQTINGEFVTIETNAGTAVYAVENKAFESGHQYTLNITVNAAAIGTTNTITGWTSEGTVNVQPTITKLRAVITPEGAIPGLFTINSDGDQVFFSQGNLQYQASTGAWRFAENQYDYVGNGTKGNVTGSTNASISSTYDGWIDLFGWGTSGWNNGNAFYQPYSSSNATSGTYTSSNGFGYGPTDGSIYGYNLTDSYANADWGVYNAISNGGNSAGLWRTLTEDEWTYLFGMTSSNSDVSGHARYRKYFRATVNSVQGIVVLPDDISGISDIPAESSRGTASTFGGKTYTTAAWSALESAGAVFLPAAGNRGGTTVYNAGSFGQYWSSSTHPSNVRRAFSVSFGSGDVKPAYNIERYCGFSVRLVRPALDPGVAFDNVTSSHKGYYIAKNGKAYSTAALAASYGTAAVARITYVGSVPGYFDNFLAIALEDASSSATIWSTQMSAANTWASSHAVTVGSTTYNSCPTTAYDQVTDGGTTSKPKSSGAVKGWRVPSVTDWKYIFAGIGGKAVDNSAVTDGIVYGTSTTSGGSDGSHRALLNKWCGQAWNATTAPQAVQSNAYWSSSERAEYTDHAWLYAFNNSKFFWNNKAGSGTYVRAVFAY